jgi:hypothetical protein
MDDLIQVGTTLEESLQVNADPQSPESLSPLNLVDKVLFNVLEQALLSRKECEVLHIFETLALLRKHD